MTRGTLFVIKQGDRHVSPGNDEMSIFSIYDSFKLRTPSQKTKLFDCDYFLYNFEKKNAFKLLILGKDLALAF